MNLLYRGQEIGADVVLFGHSHRLGAELVDETLFVNPGSLLSPRGGNPKSFAIIQKEGKSWTVTFYTNGNQEISSHSFRILQK